MGLKISVIWLAIILLSACTRSPPTPAPTVQTQVLATPAPLPTATPRPEDERFAAALQQRITSLDILPPAGREATIALYVRKPSHLFPDNAGVVLHFGLGELLAQDEALRAAALLIGSGVIVAGEQGVALSGIEVVYYADQGPYMAWGSEPPWGAEQMFFSPIADELRQELERSGAPTLTPTPKGIEPPRGRRDPKGFFGIAVKDDSPKAFDLI